MTCIPSIYAAAMCVGMTAPVLYTKAERYEPEAVVVMAARFHGLPETIALAVAETESQFNCNAVGKAGEIGLFQIKPMTAFYLGYVGSVEALKNCTTNSFYGVMHLKRAYDRCGKDHACTISLHQRGLKAKPRPMSAYVQKVKKSKKAEAWVR